MKQGILFLGLVFGVLFWACQTGSSDQASEEAEEQAGVQAVPYPDAGTVVFENDYARVRKVRLEPGAEQPEHEGQARVIYSLNDYTIEWREGGSNLGMKEWKAGEVHFHQAGLHSAQNRGDQAAEWLVFERKSMDLPPCGDNTTAEDLASKEGGFAKTLFENDLFKVNQVTIEPGVTVPVHAGVNRVLYALSDFTLEFTREGEEDDVHNFVVGEARWQDACRHASKNIGETTASFLVVAY